MRDKNIDFEVLEYGLLTPVLIDLKQSYISRF